MLNFYGNAYDTIATCKIIEFVQTDGKSPFRGWFDGLDTQAATKVITALGRMELGNTSNAKRVGGGVMESRIQLRSGYRIYFGQDGERLIRLMAPNNANRLTSPTLRRGGTNTSNERRRAANMALTRDFKETVKSRVATDSAFREALLKEALELMMSGEADVGRLVLRDYINATIGFEALAKETGTPSKSLMRMFSPKGNPRAIDSAR